jgi:hypothetical protein
MLRSYGHEQVLDDVAAALIENRLQINQIRS